VTIDWRRPYALVGLIGRRWTLVVLAELAAGGRRYQDLHDALDGVSPKVLTDTLRRAERDGFIRRHLDSERTGTATLYELTDLGRSLDEPLAALGRWVDANWELVEAAQRDWASRTRS
jgi:DNA-binding HxlR family transcriptional regulator